MGEVNEKSEAEVARLIKQQRERDDQVGLTPAIALRCLVCTVFQTFQQTQRSVRRYMSVHPRHHAALMLSEHHSTFVTRHPKSVHISTAQLH